jgi:hypothetical protein
LTAILTRALGGDPTERYNLLWLHAWADSMEAARRDPPAPSTLEGDIRAAINRHSAESGSNTSDFILAEYLIGCLRAFDAAVDARENWYGRTSKTCSGPFMPAPGRCDPYGELVCEEHGTDCIASEVTDSRTQCDRWRDLTVAQRAALPVGTRARVDDSGEYWALREDGRWLRFSPSSIDLTICAAPPNHAFVIVPGVEASNG